MTFFSLSIFSLRGESLWYFRLMAIANVDRIHRRPHVWPKPFHLCTRALDRHFRRAHLFSNALFQIAIILGKHSAWAIIRRQNGDRNCGRILFEIYLSAFAISNSLLCHWFFHLFGFHIPGHSGISFCEFIKVSTVSIRSNVSRDLFWFVGIRANVSQGPLSTKAKYE